MPTESANPHKFLYNNHMVISRNIAPSIQADSKGHDLSSQSAVARVWRRNSTPTLWFHHGDGAHEENPSDFVCLSLAMMLSSAQGHQTLSPQTFPLLSSVCSTAFIQSVPLSYVKGHGIETCGVLCGTLIKNENS